MLRIPVDDYVKVAGIAVGLGVAVAGIVYLIQKGIQVVKQWHQGWTARREHARFRKALALKGVAATSQPAWVLFMKDQANYSHLFGREYAPMVRIYFRNPIDGRNYVEGLVRRYDDDPPYNIGLRRKYYVDCTQCELLHALTRRYEGREPSSSLFEKELKDHKDYRAKTAKNLGVNCDEVESIVQSFVQRFGRISNLNQLNELLEDIDFSRLVESVISRLPYDIPPSDYEGFVFVSGDNIGHIEVLKYDVAFAVSVRSGAVSRIIPEAYSYSKWIVSKDDAYKEGVK